MTAAPTRSGWTGERLPRRSAETGSAASRDSSPSPWSSSSAVSGLTARLFYLQIVDGGRFATLSARNRTVLEAIPSPRGLIYDRNGRPLVTNVPTFVGQDPSGRPAARSAARGRRPPRGPARHAMRPRSTPTIDGNPGSRSTSSGSPRTSTRTTARLISEAGFELPGVEVVVEARRQYTDGPLMSQILGYTGPVSARAARRSCKDEGYLPDDLIGKAGVEVDLRDAAARHVRRARASSATRRGQRTQVLQTISDARPGDSLDADDRHEGAAERAEGAASGR